MSLGLYAEKLGMSRVFNDKGEHIPVTVLCAKSTVVVENKTSDKNNYEAVVIGFNEVKENKLNKPQIGFFKKNNLPFYKNLKEFRINTKDQQFATGDAINVEQFTVGDWVDVRGVSRGKGFAGVMKRHNFGGLRASHGVSVSHRSHGSTGNSRTEGKVYKGKKMAGQMGNKAITQQNLQIISIVPEHNILLIKGSLPGAKGTLVRVKPSVKKLKNNS